MFSNTNLNYVAAGLFGAGTALIFEAISDYVINHIFDNDKNAEIKRLKEQVQHQEEVLRWIIKNDIDLQKDSEN